MTIGTFKNPTLKEKTRMARRTLKRRLHDLRICLKGLIDHGSYMDRLYFVAEEKKLIYVSNCKAASSSIKASMLSLGEQENYHLVNGIAKKSGHFLSNIAPDAFPGYYRFSYVRNPFERLVSCYENKYHSDKELLGWDGRREKGLYFDRYLLGVLAKDRGFARFAKRVCRIPDMLSDRHIVSQYYMLHQKGREVASFVGRFEDLPHAYEPIREKYGLAPLPHYNKTQADKKSWMDRYDLDTAERVYRRYRRDIESYGYRADYERLIEYLKGR